DAKSILLGAAAALERHHSVEYTGTMRMKLSYCDDTVSVQGKCQLQRIPNDTTWGGKFRISILRDYYKQDILAFLYDLNYEYTIAPKENEVIEYDIHNGQTEDGNNSIRKELIWRDFFQPQRLKGISEDSTAFIGRVIIHGIPCYEIFAKVPDKGTGTEVWGQITWVYISEKDSLPIFQKWAITHHDVCHYQELLIEKYHFDDIPDIALTEVMDSGYMISPYDPNSSVLKTLDSNMTAPALSGKMCQGGMDSTSIDFNGKVTLLDFWDMECHWCIKSFPQLDRICAKYNRNTFQLIGVNSIDNNEERRKKLPAFLERNKMVFNSLLVSDDIPKTFSAKVCPCYYLIDKNGKVAFAQVGYSDDLYEKLDKRISQLLK
ncbi:MAG TPA: thioredoxin-like domain-containing protein, partial [Candidatus Kapabacteria bacterium]|nr:thioredoxin-like domain-containing protein [Candidatus Kapabacteria bacterium]